ncbi:MAG: hypothetical protein ACI4L8_10550 [Candidatus Fimadaptatus sp.]
MVHVVNKRRKTADLFKKILKQWQLYLLILLPLAYVIIFNYIPMGGIVIAFKNFKASKSNIVQFIIGEKDIDNDWDAYVAGLEQLDMARYIEIYQNALDARG